MRRSIVACGLLLLLAGMTAAVAAAAGSTGTNQNPSAARTQPREHTWQVHVWSRRLQRYRAGTRRWLTVIHGRPPRLAAARRLQARTPVRLRRLALKWRHREHAAWRRANHPPDLRGWLCIHHYEGSWTDTGGPYWGGLQMDLSFQQSYGGWLLQHHGTADHWSPLEQMWVAVRAWRVRGYSPWPNTARFCGLY